MLAKISTATLRPSPYAKFHEMIQQQDAEPG